MLPPDDRIALVAGDQDYRSPIELPGDSAHLASIKTVTFILHRPDGSQVIKNLTKAADQDPTTKQWSWLIEAGDFPMPGNYASQVIDTTDGRRMASEIYFFRVGERL